MALASLATPLRASEGSTSQRPEILDRSISFHGGWEAYRALHLSFDLCSKSGCSEVEVRHRGDDWEQRVVGKRRGELWEVRVSPETLVVRREGQVVEVAPERVTGWRDWANSKIWFSMVPFRLADPSARWEDRGIVEWDGRQLHELRVSFAAGTSTGASDGHRYWFDPETGRLERFAYDYEESGGGLRYRELYNYRRVGGILLFDQRNLGIDGPVTVDELEGDRLDEQLREVSRVELRKVRELR